MYLQKNLVILAITVSLEMTEMRVWITPPGCHIWSPTGPKIHRHKGCLDTMITPRYNFVDQTGKKWVTWWLNFEL